MKGKFVCMALALVATTASYGATIYDNGMPNQINATASDSNLPRSVANGFTLSLGSDSLVERITWWGVYNDGLVADDFTVFIYESDTGAPSNTVVAEFSLGTVNRFDTGDLLLNIAPIYEYTSSITPTLLSDNALYFLSIVNNTTVGSGSWFWATSGFSGTSYFRDDESQPWADNGQDYAFRLENNAAPPVVPVPAPAMLGVLGIGLVGAARRFRGRAA